MKFSCYAAGLLMVLAASAAERKLDFSQFDDASLPKTFRSAVTGEGGPGTWQIVMDEVPSVMQQFSPKALSTSRKSVLAQVSENPADERFPLLILTDGTYGDFKLTTRVKMVKGKVEQMGGIAFRLQDETNYYVVRASALGNTFRFYKVVNGMRGNIIGPEVPISSGEWHELGIECKGNQIRCSLNGKELIPALTDNSFTRGKIAFWTKSDSVTYFSDTVIQYTATEHPAESLVRSTLAQYSRLIGLDLFVMGRDLKTPVTVGSKERQHLGQDGGTVEADVIRNGGTYYRKNRGSVEVTMPLRDRNGETIAAVRVTMETFAGQTEQNALARALPIIKYMQARVQSIQDLVD